MLHLQGGGMSILYTDHVNDHVCLRFHEEMEVQWLIWRGETRETYQTGKLPEPDHCLVEQLQGILM